MEVVVASRFGGFCGGVTRAWRKALEAAAGAESPVYLSGKLIHNDPAMRELRDRGVILVESLASLPPKSTVVVRAHGEAPSFFEEAERRGLRVVDATCPIVKTVQQRARALEDDGYQVVLFGHRRHPEAVATIARTRRGVIIETVEEAGSLVRGARVALIAQTTASEREFGQVRELLRGLCRDFVDYGRVCGWTLEAQREASEIARQVDAMIVIGGHESSNTHRLVEVCAACCRSYHVETAANLRPEWFVGVERVGVTAGASTRESDIREVVAWLRALPDTPPA